MVDTDVKIATFLLDELGRKIWVEMHADMCSRCEKPCRKAKDFIQWQVLVYLEGLSRLN